MRTEPLPNGPDVTVRGPGFSVRKRADGGYTVSTLASNIFDLTPDSFRFLRQFIPTLRLEWSSLRPRVGRRFVEEMREMRPFGPDQPSPSSAPGYWIPKPNVAMTEKALKRLSEAFPAFRDAKVAQRWAGYIDVIPDAVPVISLFPVLGRV
jgi:glycine/D-amino acid oxidase-like deaminating enzyme